MLRELLGFDGECSRARHCCSCKVISAMERRRLALSCTKFSRIFTGMLKIALDILSLRIFPKDTLVEHSLTTRQAMQIKYQPY